MNTRASAATVHVHIGRLVIDSELPGSSLASAELIQQLQASLSALGDARDAAQPSQPRWVDSVASAVAARVTDAIPGRQVP